MMGTKKLLVHVLILTLPLVAAETYHYTVYFWKIPCLDITMILSDREQSDQTVLTFTTKTKEVFSYFFSVHNTYKTVFDQETFQMLRYEKTVKQPNMEQDVTIVWKPMEGSYQHEKTAYERPVDTHNIFSLLMRARSMDWQSLDTRWWNVDHEGQFFRSRYLWIDSTETAHHYRLDLVPGEDEDPHLLEMTDVFSWGITLEDCVREIWIERGGENRILEAAVTVRGFKLVARLNE